MDENEIRIGDIVTYTGRYTWGTPRKGCTVEQIDRSRQIFSCEMATLSNIDHWVTISELIK